MIDKKEVPIEILRDVSSQWNVDLYEGLKTLERFEKIVKIGDDDLLNWIRVIAIRRDEAPLIFAFARVQAIQFFLEQFRILLESYKTLLSREEYERMQKYRNECIVLYTSGKITRKITNGIELQPDFFKCSGLIASLRSDFINCEGINKRLFVSDKSDKGEER